MNPKIVNSNITQERLKSLVVYREDGELLWLSKPHANSKGRVGEPIGSLHKSSGYKRVQLDGERYTVHMLVWLYHYGEYPSTDIDHRDTNKINNRIDNLRLAEEKNTWNTPKNSNNKSGYKGVSWHPKSGKWAARVMKYYKTYNLGLFESPELASLAVEAKRVEIHEGFVNHG